MDRIQAKLLELGYRLREPAGDKPFDRVRVVGDLAYVSGHGPVDENGVLTAVGRVGSDVSAEDAYLAARQTAVNCLSSLKAALGSLDRVIEFVKVLVFVNSSHDFFDQPAVADGFTRREQLAEEPGSRG